MILTEIFMLNCFSSFSLIKYRNLIHISTSSFLVSVSYRHFYWFSRLTVAVVAVNWKVVFSELQGSTYTYQYCPKVTGILLGSTLSSLSSRINLGSNSFLVRMKGWYFYLSTCRTWTSFDEQDLPLNCTTTRDLTPYGLMSWQWLWICDAVSFGS